jgi:HK97 family phage major capsid protein
MTDEQLEDEPSARSYVQQRLTYMMQAKLDSEVLLGTGTAPRLQGTEQLANIQTQAKGADSILDAMYKLFTQIRVEAFAEPTVAFINPSKWQEVALLTTADGQYIWNHPSTTGPLTAWGVPVVLTTAHTSTKVVTGDYSTYSMLFNKRGIDVQTTNAHDDFFIKGKQAIRMDLRCVMVHFRPTAFGVVTGL